MRMFALPTASAGCQTLAYKSRQRFSPPDPLSRPYAHKDSEHSLCVYSDGTAPS